MSEGTKLAPIQDFAYIEQMAAEVFSAYFYPVDFYPLDRSTTRTDNLYVESDRKNFLPQFPMDMWTDRNPRQRILTRFGFDTPRDLLVVFDNKLFRDLGKPLPDVGDRVFLDHAFYEIALVRACGRWINVDARLYTAAMCDKVRPERFTPPTTSSASKPLSESDIYQ